MRKNDYGVIHISTHGYYNDSVEINSLAVMKDMPSMAKNPYDNCGFYLDDMFEDGSYSEKGSILLGTDLLTTDLSQTRLAVLSTCDSGLGALQESGDWLLGMQRAFFIAGVHSLVVSLWKVDADATALLMKHFYRYLISGRTVNHALHRAKLEVMRHKNGIYNTPFYWAGFVAVGKPVTIYSDSKKEME